ncbi:GntR family transcriptional regulator [Rubrimonas cliftonensis]|uniref:Transcriptional regulator, GntR family n=1 Tax=Rubrimonas cliftonensis TaxID=89524 RepID=A0A1H4B622_9RHOB|nr:GntR family transcriptional regulator [Rubrimonas cliftonensis]SEA43580.1 transcriptional regulator, GntR family [Rubrimonas cliftonensis]
MAGGTGTQAGAPRETAVALLVKRLSAQIVEGALAPGVRLDEQSLAEAFGVSRTPVREALAQLAAMGLVERRPHRGVVVAGLSLERLLHLFELMTELEGVCARLAALRMTNAERARLLAGHEAARRLAEAEDVEGYADANRLFHLAIYDGAHNPALVETTRDVRNRVAPFRRAQFQVHGRPSLSWGEHDAVVSAILAQDAETACSAMREHILKVKDAYRAFAHLGAPEATYP